MSYPNIRGEGTPSIDLSSITLPAHCLDGMVGAGTGYAVTGPHVETLRQVGDLVVDRIGPDDDPTYLAKCLGDECPVKYLLQAGQKAAPAPRPDGSVGRCIRLPKDCL